ncbi:uncharacterized protein PHACADRAFT_210248 [Phanerochaete carnosa HHB-10118-sp]|uniref:Uncharacterized protein n=1 Tax=Phanerochaete carnosa (strain HHB-10118-sp) TaxID=650164 RepID=K5W674_PHACS|nr:uncharacterized protein PHACADRAFT_210248 [Phanerochaete carnosa HHB-10118-sp]EKM54449.1 hypothetical protein PHACADRAFT_210248 [Phanerochaete carnosa HHB-10118-sp]
MDNMTPDVPTHRQVSIPAPFGDPANVGCAQGSQMPVQRPISRRRATDEEKMRKAEMKVRRKQWEMGLQVFGVEDPEVGMHLLRGTEVMYRSDAKEYYKLSERELAALPYQVLSRTSPPPGFPERWGRNRSIIVPLQAVIALVQRRYASTGAPMPENAPLCTMVCTGTGDAHPSTQRRSLL